MCVPFIHSEHVPKENRRSDERSVQVVTLADLLHIPLGNVIFGQFEVDLNKLPNVQRKVTFPTGSSGLLTRRLQMVDRYLVQALVAGSSKGCGLMLRNEGRKYDCTRHVFVLS
jgi:hypothetical protein